MYRATPYRFDCTLLTLASIGSVGVLNDATTQEKFAVVKEPGDICYGVDVQYWS